MVLASDTDFFGSWGRGEPLDFRWVLPPFDLVRRRDLVPLVDGNAPINSDTLGRHGLVSHKGICRMLLAPLIVEYRGGNVANAVAENCVGSRGGKFMEKGWLVATVCGVGRNGIHGTNFREYAHIRIVRCCGCVADSVSNEEQPLEDDALMATIKCLQYSST